MTWRILVSVVSRVGRARWLQIRAEVSLPNRLACRSQQRALSKVHSATRGGVRVDSMEERSAYELVGLLCVSFSQAADVLGRQCRGRSTFWSGRLVCGLGKRG
jgi:hypothetical protein